MKAAVESIEPPSQRCLVCGTAEPCSNRQGILTSPRPSHTVIKVTPHILTPGHLAGIAQNGGARPNISSAKKGFGVLDGQIIDFSYHMQRLSRSLKELEIQPPMSEGELFDGLMGLVKRNSRSGGFSCVAA